MGQQGLDVARLAIRASLRDVRLPTTLTGYLAQCAGQHILSMVQGAVLALVVQQYNVNTFHWVTALEDSCNILESKSRICTWLQVHFFETTNCSRSRSDHARVPQLK